MKSIKKLRKWLILPLFIFATLFSCQDEVVEVTEPNEEQTLVANSNLANLMSRTSANDGSVDNIIDNANCLEIELPVTVVVNGVEVIVDSVEDYDVIEDIFEEFSDDDDDLEIVFPITIILADFSEIEIANEEELNTFIDDCLGENVEDEDIECIDFQYPISISIFNTDFEVIDTIIIESDEALYDFLDDLEEPIIASLNFPVTMILSDGSTVEVNSNQELGAIIEDADDDCDEDDDYDYDDDDEYDCTEESVELALKECLWYIDSFNNSSELEGFDIDFTDNYDLFVSSSETGNVVAQGNWTVSLDGDYIYLDLDVAFEGIGGNWKVVDCYNDELELIRGQDTMVLEQDCSANPNNCSIEELQVILMECSWIPVSIDGSVQYNNYNFYFNANGELIFEGNGETISDAWFVVANPNGEGINLVIDPSGASTLQNLAGEWNVTNCGDEYLVFQDTNNIELILERACNNFPNEGYIEVCDDNTQGNNAQGVAEVDLTSMDSYFLNGNSGSVSYHTSEINATNNVDPLPVPATIDIADSMLYVRIESNGSFQISILNYGIYFTPTVPDGLAYDASDADNDGVEEFDLSLITNDIELSDSLVTAVEVFYYETLNDAENNTNAIGSQSVSVSVNQPITLYAKVISLDSNLECSSIGEISLQVF